MNATLHYIFDPLCGWCYGAEPLARAAADVPGLAVELHAGGLWPEPTVLPEETRRYIEQADTRLSEMTGQPLGAAYRRDLLFDPALVLDSRPVTTAVLAAERLAHQGLRMLWAIQHAHYVNGRHVVRDEVLDELAAGLGIDPLAFAEARDAVDADAHIAATRALMRDVGAQGFPTFVLEIDGRLYGVNHNRFHRNAGGFAESLAAAVSQTRTQTAT